MAHRVGVIGTECLLRPLVAVSKLQDFGRFVKAIWKNMNSPLDKVTATKVAMLTELEFGTGVVFGASTHIPRSSGKMVYKAKIEFPKVANVAELAFGSNGGRGTRGSDTATDAAQMVKARLIQILSSDVATQFEFEIGTSEVEVLEAGYQLLHMDAKGESTLVQFKTLHKELRHMTVQMGEVQNDVSITSCKLPGK